MLIYELYPNFLFRLFLLPDPERSLVWGCLYSRTCWWVCVFYGNFEISLVYCRVSWANIVLLFFSTWPLSPLFSKCNGCSGERVGIRRVTSYCMTEEPPLSLYIRILRINLGLYPGWYRFEFWPDLGHRRLRPGHGRLTRRPGRDRGVPLDIEKVQSKFKTGRSVGQFMSLRPEVYWMSLSVRSPKHSKATRNYDVVGTTGAKNLSHDDFSTVNPFPMKDHEGLDVVSDRIPGVFCCPIPRDTSEWQLTVRGFIQSDVSYFSHVWGNYTFVVTCWCYWFFLVPLY